MSVQVQRCPVDLSVVLISYNQERTIGESLQSVIDQTAFDRIREIIVIDDHSADRSAEVARRVGAGHPKVKVIEREVNSGGAATPRNDGLAHAGGTHVAFLDGDDLWLPGKTDVMLEVLERHPEVGLLYCDFIAFDDATKEERRTVCNHVTVSDPDQLEKIFVHGGPILPSCAIVAKAATDTVGGMDPTLRFNEEQEFWLRIMTCMPAHHVPATLVRRREWFGSLGSAKYGLENLECKREITTMVVDRVPRLAAVVSKRHAQIELKTAVHHFGCGETSLARQHLRQALILNPGLAKARLYLALSYLSSEPEGLLHRLRQSRARLLGFIR